MDTVKSALYSLVALLILGTASAWSAQSLASNTGSTPSSDPIPLATSQLKSSSRLTNDAETKPGTQEAALPRVGEFKSEQLFSNGGGGCGMTLWKASSTNKQHFIFFNGVEKDSMRMVIDGKMVRFRRVAASGKEFYRQKTSQTFQSLDGKIRVGVDVALGARGEIESVAVKEGTIQVKRDGQQVKIPVIGDAGC